MKGIDKKTVGKQIRQIRLSRGYTLQGFGDLMNASRGNVQCWESGHCLPNKKRLVVISKLGNMTVNQLLYGDREQDIEELYQELIKLPKEELIILMLKIAQNKGEKK